MNISPMQIAGASLVVLFALTDPRIRSFIGRVIARVKSSTPAISVDDSESREHRACTLIDLADEIETDGDIELAQVVRTRVLPFAVRKRGG